MAVDNLSVVLYLTPIYNTVVLLKVGTSLKKKRLKKPICSLWAFGLLDLDQTWSLPKA